MATKYTDALLILQSHPFFEDLRRDLLALRPVIPTFDPRQDNTDDWKYNSAAQEGFDKVLAFFQISKE